jgi:hypothetical protein
MEPDAGQAPTKRHKYEAEEETDAERGEDSGIVVELDAVEAEPDVDAETGAEADLDGDVSAASEGVAELAPLGADALRAHVAQQRQTFERLVALHCAHTGLDLEGAPLSQERVQELRDKAPAFVKPYDTVVPPWIEVVPEAGAPGDRSKMSASMEAQATRIRVQVQPLLSRTTGSLEVTSVPAFVELMTKVISRA